MHEMSLMQQVIDVIQAQLDEQDEQGQKEIVREVRLEVGMLDIHSEAAFRQAFEVLAKGTRLEGAALELTVEPAVILCTGCGYRGTLTEGDADPHDPNPYVPCPRCGAICPVQGGHGVGGIELTMDQPENKTGA
jgi:hydrogenase nickel incorporation protein HypA/HybF